ncbi:hypothetical protein SUDANB108_07036 [Streptomyces sp. enrichment culture]
MAAGASAVARAAPAPRRRSHVHIDEWTDAGEMQGSRSSRTLPERECILVHEMLAYTSSPSDFSEAS